MARHPLASSCDNLTCSALKISNVSLVSDPGGLTIAIGARSQEDTERPTMLTEEELKAITTFLSSNLANEGYHDGIKDPLRELSGLTTDIVKALRYLLAPIQRAAFKQDQFRKRLEAESRDIPVERRREIPEQLLTPVMRQIEYRDDHDPLVEMFACLLKKAMDRATDHIAHPSFPHIITQLSPDEAIVLHQLGITNHHRYHGLTYSNAISTFPTDHLIYPHNLFVYYSHLITLGLIQEQDITTESEMPAWGPQPLRPIDALIELTEFGRMFVKACDPAYKETEQ